MFKKEGKYKRVGGRINLSRETFHLKEMKRGKEQMFIMVASLGNAYLVASNFSIRKTEIYC